MSGIISLTHSDIVLSYFILNLRCVLELKFVQVCDSSLALFDTIGSLVISVIFSLAPGNTKKTSEKTDVSH